MGTSVPPGMSGHHLLLMTICWVVFQVFNSPGEILMPQQGTV